VIIFLTLFITGTLQANHILVTVLTRHAFASELQHSLLGILKIPTQQYPKIFLESLGER